MADTDNDNNIIIDKLGLTSMLPSTGSEKPTNCIPPFQRKESTVTFVTPEITAEYTTYPSREYDRHQLQITQIGPTVSLDALAGLFLVCSGFYQPIDGVYSEREIQYEIRTLVLKRICHLISVPYHKNLHNYFDTEESEQLEFSEKIRQLGGMEFEIDCFAILRQLTTSIQTFIHHGNPRYESMMKDLTTHSMLTYFESIIRATYVESIDHAYSVSRKPAVVK